MTVTPPPGIPRAIQPVNVKDYGAIGDGSTDNLARLQAANTAAAAAGRALYIPAGTYIISAVWIPTVSIVAAPGAVIKKAASLASTSGIQITTANISIENLTVDGNVDAGAAGCGIRITDVGGIELRNILSKNNKSSGFVQESAGADVRYFNCKGIDNVSGNGPNTGGADGFTVNGGVGRFYGAYAATNDRSGIRIAAAAADGCYVDLYAYRNLNSGLRVANNNGTVGRLVAVQSRGWGLAVGGIGSEQPTNWHFDSISCRDIGLGFTFTAYGALADNTTATSVELYGAQECEFGTIISRKPLGYGVAVAQNTAAVGSFANQFGTIIADQGTMAEDPAVHISGDSTHNNFGTIISRGHSFAFTTGEDFTGTPSDNVIGTLIAVNATFSIWQCRAGINNRIGNVLARNCSTGRVLFDFNGDGLGSGVTDNVVGSFTHRTDLTVPSAVITQTNGAVRNAIGSELAALEVNATGLTSGQVDALFGTTPTDGMIASDPTRRKLMIKQAGAWRTVTSDVDRDNGQPGMYFPGVAMAGPSTITLVANTAYLSRICPSRDMPITLISFAVSTAAGADDAVDVGIYDASLNRLASSGATTGKLNSSGTKTVAVSYLLKAGTVYYVAISSGTQGGSAGALRSLSITSTNTNALMGTSVGILEMLTAATSHPLPPSVTGSTAFNNPVGAVRES